jgi:hypothetical protein
MGSDKKKGGQLAASLRLGYAMQTKAHPVSCFPGPQVESSKAQVVFHISDRTFGLDTALLPQDVSALPLALRVNLRFISQ